ncbi:MAG: hypothetical protein ACKVHO_09585 [Verrucomicrobiia bacterium]|jgi:hypothetical protein
MKTFLLIGAALILTVLVWLSINARWVARQVLAGGWRGRHSDGREVALEIDDEEQANKAGTFLRVFQEDDRRIRESGRWSRSMCELKLHIEQRDDKPADELEELYLFWESPDNLGMMDENKQRTDLNRSNESIGAEFKDVMANDSDTGES